MPCQPGERDVPRSGNPDSRASPTGTVTLPPTPKVSGDCCCAPTRTAASNRTILTETGRSMRIGALLIIDYAQRLMKFRVSSRPCRLPKRDMRTAPLTGGAVDGNLKRGFLLRGKPDTRVDRDELPIAAF